jgi:EAL domain-containing protein (putative c-di-GMP-specific phosphodiesterase class I)
VHYEILIRMIDEAGELIPPMAFIPSAERYHLMPAIDRLVVRKTIEWLAQQPATSVETLSINVTNQSLSDDQFLEFVMDQFAQWDVPAERIWFEITETTAVVNWEGATRFIQELRARGCRFALDDFGSGMSSFGYLKNLPVDFIKIDGRFIRDITKDDSDVVVVDAINRVAHLMGKRTIAEFVADDAILAKLRELGVDFAQGYAIHAPEPIVGGSATGASVAN